MNAYVFELTMCVGPSMLPTFSTAGDIVVVSHVFRPKNLKKGDIVIALSPTNAGHTVCKRVTGLPGDNVRGRKLPGERMRKLVVPEGRVWLEGDNASNSTDSRTYGPVPAAMVKGKVLFRVWPLTQFGRLD